MAACGRKARSKPFTEGMAASFDEGAFRDVSGEGSGEFSCEGACREGFSYVDDSGRTQERRIGIPAIATKEPEDEVPLGSERFDTASYSALPKKPMPCFASGCRACRRGL